MRVHSIVRTHTTNVPLRFGATETEPENGARSWHYKPRATVVKPNGDSVESLSVSVYEREQNARVLNTNVLPVSKNTKNRVTGALFAVTVCLAAGGIMLPALFLPAACCGIAAGALLLCKGRNSPPKE